MRKIISAVLMFLICISIVVPVYAEENKVTVEENEPAVTEDVTVEEGTEKVVLRLDNKNVYEGMNQAYKNGYQPTVAKGKVTVVVPLLCDGKIKNDTLTAAIDLGATDNSPFVYRNYEKDFKLKNGVFLISFTLNLAKNRNNGIYPIIVHVYGSDEDGGDIQQSYTNYVEITDGIDPNAPVKEDIPVEEIPTSAPVVMLSNSNVSPENVKAGEEFEAILTIKNTSKLKAVQNLTLTVNVPSSDFEIKNDSSTIFVGKLGKEQSTEVNLKFAVSRSIPEGNYPIEISMSYDDPKANTYNSSGSFMVTVEQPINVELTMPNIQKEMLVGDTVPLTFQVMNLGRNTINNVRCDVECNGLSQTKTAFIGNMDSGTAGEGDLNLFVVTLDGDEKYGNTEGKVILTYEDCFGNEYTQEYPFGTSILARPEIVESNLQDEPEAASQWWISISILTGIILIIGCSATAYFIGRKKR